MKNRIVEALKVRFLSLASQQKRSARTPSYGAVSIGSISDHDCFVWLASCTTEQNLQSLGVRLLDADIVVYRRNDEVGSKAEGSQFFLRSMIRQNTDLDVPFSKSLKQGPNAGHQILLEMWKGPRVEPLFQDAAYALRTSPASGGNIVNKLVFELFLFSIRKDFPLTPQG